MVKEVIHHGVENVFIYGLVDPIDGEIYYVGQSMNPHYRLSQHLAQKASCPKSEWINDLKLAGLTPCVKILQVSNTENWVQDEKEWIAYGHEHGWPLTNLTNGGEGSSLCRRIDYGLRQYIIPIMPHMESAIMSLKSNQKLDLMCAVAIASMDEMREYYSIVLCSGKPNWKLLKGCLKRMVESEESAVSDFFIGHRQRSKVL